jgi:transposase
VLLAGEGFTNEEIIRRTGLHRNSVSKWRNLYHYGGLKALNDKPRPG